MGLDKPKDEVTQTVRKKDGKIFDLAKDVPTKQGKTHLTKDEMMGLFGKLRVRYTLTPQCNVFCNCCSLEGLGYASRLNKPADIDMIIKLSDMLLANTPLKSIDFSGGEPTLHPDFQRKEYKLARWADSKPGIRFSIHTNGIELTPEIVDNIKNGFSRIGISIHSTNYDTWNKITNTFGRFPELAQREKFDKMMYNLESLAQQGINEKVHLKSVVMRGYNDSEEELGKFLETCEKYGFHPKFLEFEPQYDSQIGLKVPRAELYATLEKLGCTFPPEIPRAHNPKEYFPNTDFTYNGAVRGLHSIFGCGEEGACLSCFDYLCMFVKPTADGGGLYLKPCSVVDTRIDLTHAIKQENIEHLVDLFKISREYLMLAPGLGSNSWNKEKEFEKGNEDATNT